MCIYVYITQVLEHQAHGPHATFSADNTSALGITLRSFVLALGSALQMRKVPNLIPAHL